MKSFIRKFAVKFIEMAGAGLASALCAYILGHMERAPAPTPMPAVVYISPANVDTALREDHSHPAAVVRTDAERGRKRRQARQRPRRRRPHRRRPSLRRAAIRNRNRERAPRPGRAAANRWQSSRPPLRPVPRRRRPRQTPRYRLVAMKLENGAAARRIVPCWPDSGKFPPGSCRKTTEFSATCRGPRCRSAIRCEARCRWRCRVEPSMIVAAAAARIVQILRRRIERTS